MQTKTLSWIAGLGVAAIATPAIADDEVDVEPMTVEPGAYSYGWHEPRLRSDIGVGVALGGGITGFTNSVVRDTIDNNVGGLWNFRASIGTHIPLGLDISYLGTAASLRTLSGFDNGTLVGTTFEAALRLNLLPHNSVNPYFFGGVGWQRYDLMSSKFSTADTGVRDEDDLIEIPMGAGLAFRDRSGLTADVRGTFRAATDSSLVQDPQGNNERLHTWEASAAVGYEF